MILQIFLLTAGILLLFLTLLFLWRFSLQQQREQQELRERFDEHQMKSLALIHETIEKGMNQTRQQVSESLNNYAQLLGLQMEKLTVNTDQKLKEISGQVERRLSEGFEKTTATFTDIVKRLALIDEAQKRITELSSSVVSLQEILSDKRSRGAFGEVQLSSLIYNMIPESHFKMQYELSNKKRADCILFLPEPSGNIVIDAKFPLENYRRLMNSQLQESEKRALEQQFKQDIKKHILDIADKYIISGETADGAVMFIPAEAIFAEIHGNYPELVELAHKKQIWLTSPTTMMAVLTTARAVLKDAATRQQIHLIQEHLMMLGRDFERFQGRMNNLAKHIKQAHEDAEKVQKSSLKITNRFNKIEKVELMQSQKGAVELLEEEN